MKPLQQKQPNLRTTAQNKRIHFLLSFLNIEDMKPNLALEYSNGRTSRTSELTFIEAQNMIRGLERVMNGERDVKPAYSSELDRKRKGVIKAIFKWYENQSRQVSMEYVKATACRAAGVDNFNKISASSLTRIYAEFCRKQRVQETMKSLHVDVGSN